MNLINAECVVALRQYIKDNSIDLEITSPPYWNQKEYSYWETYELYLNDVKTWVNECFRVLKQGRHCFWIIPDKLPWPPKANGTRERLYMPIYADTERLAQEAGFVCEFPIIWKKPHGSQKMFGSYPYPPTVIHTPMTERICVWRKPGKPDLSNKSPESAYTKTQWVDWAQDLWEIGPETSVNHPAPFPVEIPKRIITMWSFVGDTVLDLFAGSFTTGVACVGEDRDFVGIEICKEYYQLGKSRIEEAERQKSIIPVFQNSMFGETDGV